MSHATPLPDFADPDSAEGLELLCAGNHPATPVDWLWPGRIAYGKVTLLASDSGLGKSLVALDVAARVTRGLPWPENEVESQETRVQSQNSAAGSPHSTLDSRLAGSVLILSAADTLTDTIRPRLDAAGADPNRVFHIPSITDLRNDFGQLRAAVDRVGDCRLIIVDPVNAYVGPADSHFHTVVRRVLTPLVRLAQEKHIAILAVTQFRKNDSQAIYRAAGSTGFVSTARSLWTVCRDRRDPSRSLLLPLKQNLAASVSGLVFRIAARPGSLAPHIAWEPETPTPSTEEAFARLKPPAAPSPDRLAAREWLQTALAAGPRPASDVIAEGELRGFLRRTLQRAFHELDGKTEKRGLLQGWWWSLAADAAIAGEPPQDIPDIFEGVAYDQDVVAEQWRHDAALADLFRAIGVEDAPHPATSAADQGTDRRHQSIRAAVSPTATTRDESTYNGAGRQPHHDLAAELAPRGPSTSPPV